MLLLFCGLLSSTSLAQPSGIIFNPESVRVHDGDTIVTNWQPVKALRAISIRIEGIDTPEIHGKCPKESDLAQSAKKELQKEINKGPFIVYLIDWDKYGGRVVGKVVSADV